MTSVQESLACLHKAVARLDELLVPWGFQFRQEESDSSSAGAYASGSYYRGTSRIHIIWRASSGLGCVSYSREELLQQGNLRERITWEIGHPGYMRIVNHAEDCHLIESGISSFARNGGDPIDALGHDLREFAAPTLSTDCHEFVSILKKGYRRRDVL